jgi:hypothetical protein
MGRHTFYCAGLQPGPLRMRINGYALSGNCDGAASGGNSKQQASMASFLSRRAPAASLNPGPTSTAAAPSAAGQPSTAPRVEPSVLGQPRAGPPAVGYAFPGGGPPLSSFTSGGSGPWARTSATAQPSRGQRSGGNPGNGLKRGSGLKPGSDPGPPIDALVQTAEKNAAAAAAWQAIQRRLQPPLCTGHRQPAVIHTVKKGGDNQGMHGRGVPASFRVLRVMVVGL